jgi:hypothetical protein
VLQEEFGGGVEDRPALARGASGVSFAMGSARCLDAQYWTVQFDSRLPPESPMTAKPRKTLTASCRCGAVALQITGEPIIGAACYCESCQQAGRRFAQLPKAPATLQADGGTPFLLYRKDRLRCTEGGDRLVEHRLKPDSPTRRMMASCCNSPMCLEFKGGHWLSVYRDRVADAPPLEVRTMTGDRPEGPPLPTDMPNYKTHSGKFMWKLLTAWVAMGFRVPKVEGVPA